MRKSKVFFTSTLFFLILPLISFPINTRSLETIEVTFMSYNINSGGQDGEKSGRKEEWLAVLKEESPDIICFQEADDWHKSRKNYLGKYQDELNMYFEEDYSWGYATNGAAQGWGDKAVLSRYPIINHTWYKTAQTEYNGTVTFDNAVQHATIEIMDECVHVFNFRLKSGPIFALDRHLEMVGILSIIKTLPSTDSVLVIADLNSYSPIDCGDSNLVPNFEAGAYTIEQSGIGPVTELFNVNYTDAYRCFYPDERGYTVVASNWGAGLQPFCRIDYIFVSPNKADDIIGSELIESHMATYGSDHYPVTATLRFGVPQSTTPIVETITTSPNTSAMTSSSKQTSLSFFFGVLSLITFIILRNKR